ncbi:hypothetical protein [Streptodolium elevatio]|uniref:Uncharacterized protein n=1 Tax=Streptodolium elevatio TaxID=3157996 RepID=A0ABV3DLA6_9ACTN
MLTPRNWFVLAFTVVVCATPLLLGVLDQLSPQVAVGLFTPLTGAAATVGAAYLIRPRA